jgi:hypothetical protein
MFQLDSFGRDKNISEGSIFRFISIVLQIHCFSSQCINKSSPVRILRRAFRVYFVIALRDHSAKIPQKINFCGFTRPGYREPSNYQKKHYFTDILKETESKSIHI